MELRSFIGGCIGGGVGIFVGHPLDTIKVRLQTSSNAAFYKGPIDCFIQVVKREGVNGLYKGVTAPLIGVSVQNAFLFGIQRSLMQFFGTDLRSQFFSGCITGALQTLISSPIEFAKIQLQLQSIGEKSQRKRKFRSTFQIFSHFHKKEGFRGIYRGFWITLLRDSVGYGVYFLSYAYLCQQFTPVNSTVYELSSERLMLAGGLTGMISWAQCFPIDVIKSRAQAIGFKPFGSYSNYLDIARDIMSTEGYRGFTKGLGTTVFRAFPVNAVTFMTVTSIERLFENAKTVAL